jgi:hypothetical protein
MTIQDLQAKRAKLLVDAHAIMAGSDVTAEQRIAVDKMLTDANTVKADIERTISLEAADAEMRSVPGRVPPMTSVVLPPRLLSVRLSKTSRLRPVTSPYRLMEHSSSR